MCRADYVRDEELKQKCQAGKSTWHNWRNASWLRSGPLYQQMKTARNVVKSHVRKCREKRERITTQARDNMFRTKDERYFNIHRRTECRKLVVNSISITDDDGLRTYWMMVMPS